MHARANQHELVITNSITPSGWWRLAIIVMCLFGQVSPESAADTPPTLEYAELLERAPLAQPQSDTGDEGSGRIALNVSGRVVDETGQPIADAFVVLTVEGDVLARTRSNAAGEYRLENVLHNGLGRSVGQRNDAITLGTIIAADKQGRMNWSMLIYGSQPSRDDRRRYDFLTDEPIADPLEMRREITLGATSALTGVVVDRDDYPLAGVQVKLIALYQGRPETMDWEYLPPAIGNLQTSTDAEGRFLFPHIPSGMVAALELSHPDYYLTTAAMATSPDVSEFPSWVDEGSNEKFAKGPARFHLNEKVVVHGKIVNQKQEPLAGAEIQFEYFGNDRTQSDAEGNFSIAISEKSLDSRNNLPPITSLQVHWPQDSPYASSWPSISKQQIVDQVPLTIVAEDAIEIQGQVIASDDLQPVANLPLKIRPWQSSYPPAIETQTDSEGRFKVNAQAGRWLITCGPKAGFDLLATDPNNGMSKGLDPQSQRIIDLVAPERSSSMAIIIDRTPAVVVRVIDAEGEPVEGAKVNFSRLDERSKIQFTRNARAQLVLPAGVTDVDGKIKFHLPTLSEGNWLLTAESPADAPRMFAATELRSNRYGEIELALVPALPVRGRVLLDGEPMADAKVVLTDDRSLVRYSGSWISTAKTNEKGEYEIFAPGLGTVANQSGLPTQYTVKLVSLPEFTQCNRSESSFISQPRGKDQDAPFVKDFEAVTATGEASGRVVDEKGEPIEGATVRFFSYSLLLGDPAKQGNATTDAAGAFHWIGVGPGKFQPVVVINGNPQSPKITIEAGQHDVEIVIPRE